MPAHVLVPFDGTPQSEAALEFAVSEWPDADLSLLYVIDPVTAGFGQRALPGSSEAWYERARETAREQFDAARDFTDHPFDTRIEVGSPARVIVDVVDEDPFDHVVLGSHGRAGVSRILLGSVAEGVVRRSSVPVTIVR
ncbi:universal stress protein [Haloplanus aerogenes]|uniref:Nucleotide-binding universal stress UspA family protein n=1 Tax=Haloplanus aerogenes TaxID=660522 RepID=A0A3M0CTE3_9EURY|nr:universal stress protein [Haloplanus aerogenes]AZH26524.1 universal stress protein [Haloplanus aerogenes]RMB12752.1 nucleotide-binding universal stress UspA family protein [Haloplanus aerogenes]